MSELRIVAGEWRGRRIQVPGSGVRPTADRVREAWLSIVRPALDGARVVDLCAGSGALGLEALSRGAAHCDFVEANAGVRRTLEENIARLGAGERCRVHRSNAVAFIAGPTESVTHSAREASSKQGGVRWEVAFADPPYGSDVALQLAERWLAEPFATIFGVEHDAAVTLPVPSDSREADRREYGSTAITFYRLTKTT